MSFTPNEYAANISRGLVPGSEPFGAYGRKATTGADSGILWPDGAFVFPATSGVQMSVVSTSANDAAAGSGIRTMDIHYLDANLASQVETVTLNGTTPVLTVATNIRFIQCVHGLTFGGTGSAAVADGTITVSNGGNNYSQISAGDMRCSSSVRMVPAGKRMIITSMYGGAVSGAAGAAVTLSLATPDFDGHDYKSINLFVPFASAAFQDGSSGLTIPCPLAFTEGQVLGMSFTTDKAAIIVGSWFGWLENA